MSDERPSIIKSITRPWPVENRMIAERQSHPITVEHPTLAGDDMQFDVVVEKIYYRPEESDGTERLCFRGKATTGTWSGQKTFFVDECVSVIDGITGKPVTNITEWLLSIHASPDPLTVESVMKAVGEYLNSKQSQLDIMIGKMGASISPDGVRISYTDISSTYQKYVNEDEDEDQELPPDELQIFIDLLVVGSLTEPISTDPDPLVVTVSPIRLAVEVIPCAAGRADVRPIQRDRSPS
jgi:hypothetical protein